MTYTFDSPHDHRRLMPAFTRYAGNPVFTEAQSSSSTTYWPWVINVTGILDDPIDTYYMWYSTDHDTGPGGIYLATAPAPVGPWTDHGLLFQDLVGGSTELPSVMWDEAAGRFNVYYRQAPSGVPGQLKLVTTADGVTGWSIVGQVITAPQPDFPGDGFCGYFRPGRVGNLWFGHHLMGGADYPHFGLSWSHDGTVWQTDPRPLGYEQHLTQNLTVAGVPRRIEWNSGQVINWRGRWLWIGMLSNFASGSNLTDRVIGCAPISPDLRSLLGPPTVLLAPDPDTYPWESKDLRALFLLHDDPGDGGGDRLWMTYQCGKTAFGLAVAEVPA